MQLQVGPPPPPPTFITVVNEDGVKLVDQEVPRSGLITANPAGEQMTGELTVIVRTAGRGESTTTIDVGENERLEIDVDRDTATVTDVRKVPVASTADTDDSNVAGD
ncbi:MAG: hypothetical protein R3316_08840 [Rhodovibrionaceae bacterium]|nr:hypothetical protein [Rhodovibrionaceae bacterium]